MKQLTIVLLFLISYQVNSQRLDQKSKDHHQQKIIVYGSDSCHSCIDTKAFLKEKGIKFTYYDIDINKEKEQEMLVKLQKASIPIHTLNLPVIDNKGTVFLNKGNLKEFLKVVDQKIKKDEN